MTRGLRKQLSATGLFLRECARRPGQIGAIAPSSRHLAEAMARWTTPRADELVLELGPGTGVITHALLKRGVPPGQLVAIEQSPRLAELLARRFPQIRVLTGDAHQLDRVLAQHGIERARIGLVVSSLPLRQLSPDVAAAIGRMIHSVLTPGGRWIQYSYHLGRERPGVTRDFTVLTAGIVWLNLPPARVSIYRKEQRPGTEPLQQTA